MIDIEVQVDGEREVLSRLGGMTEAVRERLRSALPELGEAGKEAAAALAPASHGKRSRASKKYGPLRSDIASRLVDHGDSLFVRVGPTKAFYGRFQETGLDVMRKPRRHRGIVGVRARLTKSGGVLVSPRRGLLRRPEGPSRPFHLPAHRFMRPAFESLQGRIVERIRAAITGGVQES